MQSLTRNIPTGQFLRYNLVGLFQREFGGGGSPVANVEFLKQVGCRIEMVRLRDYGIYGNGNLMLLDKNNHEVFTVIRD